MPSINYRTNPSPPPPARAPRSLAHSQPQFFTGAGENLTFEIAGGEACSLPRVHLIYAECQANCLRFRFPLHRVVVRLSPTMILPANLPASESQYLLDEILSGEVSVLYAGQPWATEPPAHARKVQTITLEPDFEQPRL